MSTIIIKPIRSLIDLHVSTIVFTSFIIFGLGYFQLAFPLDHNNSINKSLEIDNHTSFSILSDNTNQNEEGLPYPNINWENPSAVEQATIFSPPRIEKVAEGIYSAIGYGVANVMMIEGSDGIIIIDTGNNVDQAQKILQAFRDIRKSVV